MRRMRKRQLKRREKRREKVHHFTQLQLVYNNKPTLP